MEASSKASDKYPSIKFLKTSVEDILNGNKTLEPRSRSLQWIKRIEKANVVNLTYGPRMGVPTVFAAAKIERVEIRPFNTAEPSDLNRIGHGWKARTTSEFIQEYSEWYAKELAKGYPVAWIYFSVVKHFE